MSYRIGQGYDAHQLKTNLPLILGGIVIPHHKGIVAHSDGDILIHSIIDAILGAYNLGDLGLLFPSNSKHKNITGQLMLKNMKKYINSKGYIFSIENIDATIILQSPKLVSYISGMKKNIAQALNIDSTLISIKATTTDYLGFIGKEKGIACLSICLINKELIK